MKAYRVVGTFPNGKTIQPFTQDVVASDAGDAQHRVESTLGSRHRVSRRAINISGVDQINPSDSNEARVISAFRDGAPAPVVVEVASFEEE